MEVFSLFIVKHPKQCPDYNNSTARALGTASLVTICLIAPVFTGISNGITIGHPIPIEAGVLNERGNCQGE